MSPFLCLWHAFARDPRAARREAVRLGFARRSWRRFSLHVNGKAFLADFCDASRKVGIKPFLMWGTLLGCVREGRFLDGDQDIDIGILHTDYARKAALLAEMAVRGYRLRYDEPYKLSLWHPDRMLHMDIDVFFPWNDNIICLAHHKGRIIGASFPSDAFSRLREATFLEDLAVLVPDRAEAVLTTIYGNWKTPAPDYDSRRDLLNRLVLGPGDPVPEMPSP